MNAVHSDYTPQATLDQPRPSYAEVRTFSSDGPFNWPEFLANPPPRTSLLAWKTANRKAKDWVTCACGSQCVDIPRTSSGAPLDPELYVMGDFFATAISQYNTELAGRLLKDIERRSTELLGMPGCTDPSYYSSNRGAHLRKVYANLSKVYSVPLFVGATYF